MKIFSGSANKPLAEKIADAMGQHVSPVEIFIFPDGERRVRILEDVVNQDTIVIQPTSTPVDSNYMELFFLAEGLKRSGARSVTVVLPYLGYQRQDHVFRDGEAVSLAVVVKILEAIGVDRVISVDLHSVKIPVIFRIPVTHLSALPLFAQTIDAHKWRDDSVLVSPDMGGIARIKKVSELLGGMPFAVIQKDRDLATGDVSAVRVEGGLAHRAFMIDDMISSGNTMIKAAALLKEKGVNEIIIFATHAVFSQEAPALLQKSAIKKVFVTDSVFIPEEKNFPKLQVVSLAPSIAQSLQK